MTPRKLPTAAADRSYANSRLAVGEKYLEVAKLLEGEAAETINVSVGLLVLAGIAAGDAICAAATGERYSGKDHAAAADLLARVDKDAGANLKKLVVFKTAAHYGTKLLTAKQHTQAQRNAQALVDEAGARLT